MRVPRVHQCFIQARTRRRLEIAVTFAISRAFSAVGALSSTGAAFSEKDSLAHASLMNLAGTAGQNGLKNGPRSPWPSENIAFLPSVRGSPRQGARIVCTDVLTIGITAQQSSSALTKREYRRFVHGFPLPRLDSAQNLCPVFLHSTSIGVRSMRESRSQWHRHS